MSRLHVSRCQRRSRVFGAGSRPLRTSSSGKGTRGTEGRCSSRSRELESELVASQKALENCIRANSLPPAKPVAAVAPQAILSVQYVNPPPPDERNANWATSIVGGTSTFPQDTHNGVIHTDSYAPVNAPVLSTAGAVTNAGPAAIPANQGITTDDSRTHPVTGWLEVSWTELPIIATTG